MKKRLTLTKICQLRGFFEVFAYLSLRVNIIAHHPKCRQHFVICKRINAIINNHSIQLGEMHNNHSNQIAIEFSNDSDRIVKDINHYSKSLPFDLSSIIFKDFKRFPWFQISFQTSKRGLQNFTRFREIFSKYFNPLQSLKVEFLPVRYTVKRNYL